MDLTPEQLQNYRAWCRYAKENPAPIYSEAPIIDWVKEHVLPKHEVSLEMTRWALFVHFGFRPYDDEDIIEVFEMLPSCEHDISEETYLEIMSALSDEWMTHSTNYHIRAMRAASDVLLAKKCQETSALTTRADAWQLWYEKGPK